MSIIDSFERAFLRMHERGWEKIYILVDIHDTIFEASYHNEETYKWFPYAKETLALLSQRKDISLILWTSSYPDAIKKYLEVFKENGIFFSMINLNSETEETDLSDFSEKTYFNVGLDDKFGFDATKDWKELYNYLKEKGN